ncbi:MAG: hypothetical protein K8J31_29030 [Anaerolineae bacterium]|nr:hypothetical protein [Anaerolineae bacterium]
MNDPHDQSNLEQWEHLRHNGHSTDDRVLAALRGTIAQASPDFQDSLEAQLVTALQARASHKENSPMRISETIQTSGLHLPRSLPVTLAAAIALLLFGGLAVVMMNAPRPEGTNLSGAAQEQLTPIPQDQFMWTATAIIAQATYQAAQSQLASAQALVEAAQKQATEQAAQAFAILQPTQMTEFSPGACQPVTLTIYANPSSDSVALMDTVLDATFQIEGTFTNSQNGTVWYLVSVDAGSGQAVIVRGWVQADILQQVCPPVFPGALSTGSLALATPTMVPFAAFTPSPVCPPQQLLLFAGPTKAAGLIAELPFDPSLHIEGSLDLNMGDSWLLVVQSGVRGWLPAQALPPECITWLAPEGVPQIDKMTAPLIPLDASPVATATPIPVQAAAATATIIPSATFVPTVTATTTATHTPSPFPDNYDGADSVQVTLNIADPEDVPPQVDINSLVDILMLVPPTHDPEIWVPVIQRAYVLEIQRTGQGTSTRVRLNLPPDSDTTVLYQVIDAGIRLKLSLAR